MVLAHHSLSLNLIWQSQSDRVTSLTALETDINGDAPDGDKMLSAGQIIYRKKLSGHYRILVGSGKEAFKSTGGGNDWACYWSL